MKVSLLIALGAAFGANLRYWIGMGFGQINLHFPWTTLFINVSGSLLIGIFTAGLIRYHWGDGWRLLLAVGLLGGYTTFSTFSLETLALIHAGKWKEALAYMFFSAALSVVGVAAGYSLIPTAK